MFHVWMIIVDERLNIVNISEQEWNSQVSQVYIASDFRILGTHIHSSHGLLLGQIELMIGSMTCFLVFLQ